MKRFVYFLVTVSIMALFCACATTLKHRGKNADDVITSLVAEVVTELKKTTFIKEPTLIIPGSLDGMSSANVKIDQFTKYFRSELIMALKREGFGAKPVMRHKFSGIQEPGMLPNLNCNDYVFPEYYLIVQVQDFKDRLKMKMMVRDRSNNYIDGFGYATSIEINDEIRHLLNKEPQNDEYLEGTKGAPIIDDKAAIAEYLGMYITCLSKKMYNKYGNRKTGIYISIEGLDKYERDVMTQLGSQMTRFGLPVSDNLEKATHVLKAKYNIQEGGLRNLWIELKDKADDKTVRYGALDVYYVRTRGR